MIDTTVTGGACPRCGTATVSPLHTVPWCPACEWNLEAYDAERIGPLFGWRWLDRRVHDIGYRMTRRQFDRLLGRPLGATGAGAATIVTAAASGLLFLGVVALAVTGLWLLVAFPFPGPSLLVAVPLLALAVGLRPRFGRLDPHADVLRRDRTPELFALVDEVAQAVGAPAPDVVAVNDELNAYAATVGFRRRRVLCLGLPYWGSLAPQERVALLGHEFGHFVNGDPRRMLLTQPAFTTLGSAADLLRPAPSTAPGFIEMVGTALGWIIQYPLSRLLFALHAVLVCVALRDIQRAEYLADEMSAKAAGTAAATDLLDATLRVESMALAVRREARAGHGPQRWQAAVAESWAANADQLPRLRQLSAREEASLFSSHPPTGLRQLMLDGAKRHEPAVVLTEDRSARIDTELAREYEAVRRTLAW
ncbi:M48 family metallopeptidase [Micromonospora sp. WMMA1363]|uniref:M48 family metallopeptidase n=1 Tax=Micromonospora sp. WMMA1363 TaxID=3053985 RepID=UPI00259D1718|nr:M48 family metallopeptidase [Micromonospora sp. WMMA1363]MDM4720108.1 M48 family metallopeptidase [Micromonospora sp. WMMA1363]